ncbi:MAG TPA: PAS domain S-box protein, partial [Candidatus Sulfotelmatobacter sp.]|nr:PAS domain S-box protein [Candidatus Sulfotelmatobacter sp.]
MRRIAPFAAIAVVFALAALADADPVLAFPLYLVIVLMASLQLTRTESLAAATLAAIAILIRPVFLGGAGPDMAPAVLLAAVLPVVAVAVGEVSRQVRNAAAEAQHNADRVAAGEQRLRTILESALVGLALTDLEGRWTQVNDRLSVMVGRGRDDLMRTTLIDVTVEHDRQALVDALALL